MSADPARLDGDDLRALVREVLRDALPDLPRPPDPPATPAPAAESVTPTETAARPTWTDVRVESDEDLAALVRAVARQCAEPQRRAELAEHGGGFRLLRPEPHPEPEPKPELESDRTADIASSDVAVLRVERGAVTERNVREAERTGARVVAAAGVVITPLARDRARSGGVQIEKEH
jgi:hypothetical protein